MAALDFPDNPSDGDTYNGFVWVAALDAWRRLPIDPAIPLGNLADVTLTSPTTNQVLKYNGSDWVNGTDVGGKILQVVSSSTSTVFTTTSTSFSSIGLSASITPSSTSSKILVIASIIVWTYQAGENAGAYVELTRNGTSVQSSELQRIEGARSTPGWIRLTANSIFLRQDSPSTTSSISYVINGRSLATSSTAVFQRDSYPSSITLMEIAG
jgi:hypothetical protein